MPWSGSPIGSTPFGLVTPVSAPAPATDGPALSRFINVGTGDYEIDTQRGQFRRMPITRQRVLLIAQTEFGSSSALRTLGIKRPSKMDEAFRSRIQSAFRNAYRRLTEVERAITIDRLTVTKTSLGRAHVLMEYTDHTLPSDERPQTLERLL
jgi:hypothetical protein